MHPTPVHIRPNALWWLPLACAGLPFAGTWIAYALSVHAGHIEACNPFWDGCTSISRAARHGLGNHVFRALVLPCAMLQILFWWLCRHWLLRQGRAVGPALPLLGLVGGVFLILYATFLGTEGDIYRLLRRYGVTVYFAATYLALLLVLRRLAQSPVDPLARPLLVVAMGMLMLGVASTAVTAIVADATLKDRWENALEWQLGLWLTAMFALFAWRWRRLRLQLMEVGTDEKPSFHGPIPKADRHRVDLPLPHTDAETGSNKPAATSGSA